MTSPPHRAAGASPFVAAVATLAVVAAGLACSHAPTPVGAQVPASCRVGGTALSPMCHWERWFEAPRMLVRTMNAEAQALLAQRAAAVGALGNASATAWQARQSFVRAQFTEALGPLPTTRTPVKANVTGTFTYEGVTVEKIVFQSRPGFYVTSALFYSKAAIEQAGMGTGALPAILFASGHEQFAFRSNVSSASAPQRVVWNLAMKGFAVFAYDPPSQGERLMYLNHTTGQSEIGWGVAEHQYFGRQMLMAGVAPASMWVWDGTRALDYLTSRTDIVDPTRVGMCGCSGGGTQTAYLSSLDERVHAASIACYVTTLHRLLQYVGPQDAEQVWGRGIARGLDIPDFVELRAPKPTQLLFTRDDQIFPISGSREALAEAQAAFEALGYASAGGSAPASGAATLSSALESHEANFHHGYAKPNREALYDFFQRTLGNPGNSTEAPVVAVQTSRLFATQTGQIASSIPGALMAHDIILQYVDAATAKLEQKRSGGIAWARQVMAMMPDVIGWRSPAVPAAVSAPGFDDTAPMFLGQVCVGASCPVEEGQGEGGAPQRTTSVPDHTIDKYVIAGEGACDLPVLMFAAYSPSVPAAPSCKEASAAAGTVLVLSPAPGAVNASSSALVAGLLSAGKRVAVASLCGFGEVGNGYTSGYGDGSMTMVVGMMTNHTTVAIHAADVQRVRSFIASEPGAQRGSRCQDAKSGAEATVAYGHLAAAALHAQALSNTTTPLAIVQPPASYADIVSTRLYDSQGYAEIPFVLDSYDLPDVAACASPSPLLLLGPLHADRDHTPVTSADASALYNITSTVYSAEGAASALSVNAGAFSPAAADAAVLAWLSMRTVPADSR